MSVAYDADETATTLNRLAARKPVYDHRTTYILNLLASNTPQAISQAAQLVAYTKCPPAKDTAYGDRDLLDRVAARDLPTAFERKVAVRVGQRPHGREGWSPVPNPRLDEIKQGRTVQQMICRGVTLADIHLASRHGWLTLGDTT